MNRLAAFGVKEQRQKRWPRLVGFVGLVVIFLLPGLVCAAENVLILNSYHRGKGLSDDTIDAIVTRLQAKHAQLTFLIEDMDTKRNSLDDLRSSLLSFYSQKYRDVELSAIVTIDNNAFDFAMENRQTLFPGVPLVFCGYNGFESSMLDGIEGVTGVTEAIDIDATVKVALALHPETTHLAIVSDTTLSGRELMKEFRQYSRHLPKSLQIVKLAELTAPELSERLSNLPKTSVVLRFSYYRDPTGRSFRIEEQTKLISEAGLPVYDFWDESIGAGYVGGYVVTGASQGKMVASILERILAGENPDQIKVVDRSPNIPVFDKRQLLRTGADMSQLPPNAILRFDEASFWQRYRKLLIGIGIAFLVLLGFAVFFAVLSFQRKRYADALSLEEQKLRATLQSIGEGVVTTNTKGEIEEFNSIAEQWIGLPIEKVHGRSVDEIFQLTDVSSDTAIALNSIGSLPVTASGRLMKPCGNSLPIVLTAAPISLSGSRKSGSVIVFRDMSRENQLQQELQQVRRLDALGQLAGGVAHDFNNVLGGIMAAAEMLSLELDNDELSEYPQMIVSSVTSAAELTAQLLSFARKQPVAKQPVHVHQIINDTVGVLTRTIDPRIEMEVQADAETDLVEGDRTLLHNSLLNLGINSSHAMPSGGKLLFATREVCLATDDCEQSSFNLGPGRYIEVRVVDTGSGIAPEVIERIFEPFFTTKDQGKGTGLGLAAVFGTVQQHEGSVTVQSTPGHGTSFTIRLPLADESSHQPEQRENRIVKGKGVVLVVDDQASVRKIARKTLESFGYEVLTANDGQEAIELFRRERQRIEVVLLDMIMPKMSGRDCFVEMQQIDPGVRVISTSGFYSPEDLHEMMRLGSTAHLPKPYRSAELSSAVCEAIHAGKKV